MPQMVGFRPLQKLNLRDQLGLNPHALFHFLGCQTQSPSRLLLLREIDERTVWNDERLQLLKQLSPTSGNKSVSGPCDINQFLSPVVADDYCVQTVQAWYI